MDIGYLKRSRGMMPRKKSEDNTWNLRNDLAVATVTFHLRSFLTVQGLAGACAPGE